MSEEIAAILERAADRLSKPGAWVQGFKESGVDDCHCAATAIHAEAREVRQR